MRVLHASVWAHSLTQVNCFASFALQLLKLSSHIRAYSPGTAEQQGCWPDCWGWAHSAKTAWTSNMDRCLFCSLENVSTCKYRILLFTWMDVRIEETS